MTIDPTAPPVRESLSAIDNALAGMMTRLRAILSAPPLTQDGLVEITAIYNNIAYIFLYLEANEEHVDYEHLLPWRDAFHKDPALDREILHLLLELRCTDPEVEESRRAYVAQLQEKLAMPDLDNDDRLGDVLNAAKSVLRDVRQDQVRLLERIGVPVGGANPAAMFYRLTSGTTSAATRAKLARAWLAQRDSHRDELVAVIDRMIAVRRSQSAAAGHRSVLASTLQKSRVDEFEIAEFLDRYLEQALAAHIAQEAEVREVTGVSEEPFDHFGFYVRKAFGGGKPPLFVLDDCLDYIFAVAHSVFGLTVTRTPASSPHVVTVDVRRDGEDVGQINFDLWDTERKATGANHTKGIRNRTDWSGLVQRPVAYVSCRFQRDRDGSSRITFQNVHSLFHEFGHAVNHLLIRKRISNRSGLEYLPLERLEYLSMWFEKWVYHPEFARHVLAPDEYDGLEMARRIKKAEYRRTYLERAVTAVLDFDVHRQPDGGLEEAFRRLDERLEIGRYCRFGDFPEYFTWPMFVANPGANFAYLLGAADSCEKFAQFGCLDLDSIGAKPDMRRVFTSCFDFDEPTDIPDPVSVFDFYAPSPASTASTTVACVGGQSS